MKMILILSLIVLLPVSLGVRHILKQKRKRRKGLNLASAYDRVVLQNKLSIEHSEVIGDRILALDKRHKKLAVVDHTGSEKGEACIDLVTVCRTELAEERQSDERIRKIHLELYGKKENLLYRICFFDIASDPIIDLPAHAKRAMHWKNRIDIHKRLGYVSLEQEFIV